MPHDPCPLSPGPPLPREEVGTLSPSSQGQEVQLVMSPEMQELPGNSRGSGGSWPPGVPPDAMFKPSPSTYECGLTWSWVFPDVTKVE